MKDYKALKTASKTSVSKTNEGVYYLTTKNYDKKSGAELSDSVEQVRIDDINIRISNLSTLISESTAEKADFEQLKTDLEAL
jgi:hypothetical protein